MSTLERAIAIAAEAHAGQVDKSGIPYILHPLRVMLRLDGDAERIVGVLHDVVEDTHWTPEALAAEGFPEAILEALDSVTHREGETYEDFVRRASMNPIGRRVKRADLEDNLDDRRIAEPTARDFARVEKYRAALEILDAAEEAPHG